MTDLALQLDGDGPLYEQIRRAIALKITSRQWRPGDRIPFESELCAALSTSRMTVNKALQSLADDGLIVRRRKAGSFVATQQSVQAPLTIAKIEDEVAADGKTYGYELISHRALKAPGKLISARIFPRGLDVLHIQCRHLADGAPVLFEDRYINLKAVAAAADEPFNETPPGSWLLEHVPWTEAEHAIYAVSADPGLAGHLHIAVAEACLRIERRTWADDETVTFVHLTYPGNRRTLVGRFQPGQRS
ncbi:MAG: UTRA domain-containing protein [Rhizobiales bacterium]|nr:UTRA domain-containing protein [Hyphomicrobiales bacterium]